jgi:hypothetical protein
MVAEKNCMLTVSIPVTLHAAAKIAAIRRGCTLRELVVAAIKADLKEGK